jgi:hypothetical protein
MLRFETKHSRWLAIATSLAGWLGCGGKAVDEPPRAEPFAAAPNRGPRAQPPSSGAARPRAEAAPSTPPLPGPSLAPAPAPVPLPMYDPRQESECDCQTDAVANVLVANCGQCHGPLAPVADSGGLTFIDDLDRLIATGLLVPLNSAASPIVIAMVNGTMPPPETGLLPVTEADINVVRQYLDNPRFWPLWEPIGSDAGGGSPAVSDAGVDLPNGDAGGDQAP